MLSIRDPEEMKVEGAEIYYRDSKGGHFTYVKGSVVASKNVTDAERDWGQKWSHTIGTILKIEPMEEVDEHRPKFRHLSGVLSVEQYKQKFPNKEGSIELGE